MDNGSTSLRSRSFVFRTFRSSNNFNFIQRKETEKTIIFFEDKQFSSKSILRPRYLSNDVNQEIGRFRQCLEKLIHIQFDASLIDSHNEFRENDLLHSVSEASTPKKSSTDDLNDFEDKENRFGDLSKVIQETFDESDDTILAGQASPSDQSLSSFRSALSVNENNLCASPEKTTFLET